MSQRQVSVVRDRDRCLFFDDREFENGLTETETDREANGIFKRDEKEKLARSKHRTIINQRTSPFPRREDIGEKKSHRGNRTDTDD